MSAVDWYNQGVDKIEAGDFQGAIADFTRAIELNPEDPDSYYNRAYAYHALGNYQPAIDDYGKPSNLIPTMPMLTAIAAMPST